MGSNFKKKRKTIVGAIGEDIRKNFSLSSFSVTHDFFFFEKSSYYLTLFFVFFFSILLKLYVVVVCGVKTIKT